MKSFLSHAGIEMRFYFPLIDLDIIYKKNREILMINFISERNKSFIFQNKKKIRLRGEHKIMKRKFLSINFFIYSWPYETMLHIR